MNTHLLERVPITVDSKKIGLQTIFGWSIQLTHIGHTACLASSFPKSQLEGVAQIHSLSRDSKLEKGE